MKGLGSWINKNNYIMRFRRLFSQMSDYYRYGMVGNTIAIETSSMCQLKCVACARTCDGSKEIFEKGVGKGYLRFKNFKKLVDGNPWIRNIELANWGEIFLNPELKDIIEYSYDRNIALRAGNGVNLNWVSEEIIESLVRCQVRFVTVSIDGASNDTYKIYRKGGDFKKVIENVGKINFYKEKYNSIYPKLRWQFIVFGHNEHELPAARKMAEELNMTLYTKLNAENWDPLYSPVRNKEFVMKETGLQVTSAKGFEEKYKRNYSTVCHQLWDQPQINWDGRLLGCCMNIYSDFGNVFEVGLIECLKSEKYVYAKKMLLSKKKPRNDIACSRCHVYRNRLDPIKLEGFGFFLSTIDRFS